MGCTSQNTGVDSLSLLQGIFPIQVSSSGLPYCRQILYQLSHKGSPRILEWVTYPFSSGSSWPRNQARFSCITGGFFTNWAIRVSLSADFPAETLQGQKELAHVQSTEKKKLTTKSILSSKFIIQSWRRDEEFLRQTKTKEVTAKLTSQETLKRLL